MTISINDRWKTFLEALLSASPEDLRSRIWRLPLIKRQWALKVQQLGFNMFGEDFRFLAFDLLKFCLSPENSRQKDEHGNLIFAAPPLFNTDLIVYSGTVDPEFAKFRLGLKHLASPFSDYRFIHPGTRWYNIASRIGMKRFFYHNSKQILDFYTGLVAKRLKEGRRPLLICKQTFANYCARMLESGLQEYGFNLRIVTRRWGEVDLNDTGILPLIHYGIIGVNLFKNFDAAFCLTGFYVNEQIVNSILQDRLAPDLEIPIQIGSRGKPLRRWAAVKGSWPGSDDLSRLAQLALQQQELDVVLQAVGRVRPYTKPREVITFQCAAHPKVVYTKEFHNLEEAREHFGVAGRRYRQLEENIVAIRQAREEGLTQRQTVARTGLSLKTVKRHWKGS